MVVCDKLFLLLLFFKFTVLQKPSIDNRRHDVYIAGFFPFGKGVENSNTGMIENYFYGSLKNNCYAPINHVDGGGIKSEKYRRTVTFINIYQA